MVDGQLNEMLFLKKIYYEKYAKKSYSLSSVDLIIDYLFKNIKKGVYIDVGCNHPIKFNNTYLLYKRGWSGINIDGLDNMQAWMDRMEMRPSCVKGIKQPPRPESKETLSTAKSMIQK